jgi:hypothetical protein
MNHFRTNKNARPAVQEHAEAVRLAWKSRHVPIGTILLVTLMLGSVLPTILTILASCQPNTLGIQDQAPYPGPTFSAARPSSAHPQRGPPSSWSFSSPR